MGVAATIPVLAGLQAASNGNRKTVREEASSDAKLTNRELQIADLAIAGYNNITIASMCGIGEQTVKNHLHRVYVKLSISGRAQLAQVLQS